MKKIDLIRFLEYSHRWRKGADIPMPQPSDISIAERAMIRILRECVSDSDDVIDIVLRDFEFNYFASDEQVRKDNGSER